MSDNLWLAQQAAITLERLRPRLQARFAEFARQSPAEWDIFWQRLDAHFPRLFSLLMPLYGQHYDFFYDLEELAASMLQAWIDRPTELKALDAAREREPLWFQSNQMLGGVCYVDLFAGDLNGIRERIPYFKELGLTYLHLMPLFKMPAGENDGGYAVSSYREVHPPLGTMSQLRELASELRQVGISLVLDFVFNHTADAHEWALRAKAGETEYQDYYWMFPDRTMPDAYEKTLREIFPDEHPGAFTKVNLTSQPPLLQGAGAQAVWVWTTFHRHQWDLNYANPQVFNRMVEEMLYLANVGVEVLRLDAVAFIWKQLGTSCESLPEAHMLIQAYNAVARIAAPALLFKSEAIVHPDEVVKYIAPTECQLSYNPLLMALLWNSLATRKVRLLRDAQRGRFTLNPDCAWVNYVRSHDDIGWTFSDEDAAQLGVKGYDHRQFLNAFYTGRFPGSFARGLPFQENPKTGDCRISGTSASLVGLEQCQTLAKCELAIGRMLLIHGIILSFGGIPLIYLGDEVGTLNDYSYRSDPHKANDSRWAHRPRTDWAKVARRAVDAQIEARIYKRLRHLISVRQQCAAFAGGAVRGLATGSDHVLGYLRVHGNQRALVLANFSEITQRASVDATHWPQMDCVELISGETLTLSDALTLAPYQLLWLQARAEE